jgi:hypothetical protein
MGREVEIDLEDGIRYEKERRNGKANLVQVAI